MQKPARKARAEALRLAALAQGTATWQSLNGDDRPDYAFGRAITISVWL
jgi:hypothetical protein